MPLARMQQAIEQLNDVSCALDVRDYVFSDRRVFAAMAPDDFSPDRPEALLVAADGDGLALSLFIDADVVDDIADHDATAGQQRGSWHTALEGVSHFVYVTWNARHRRTVTPLELELQADIDRYALCLLGSFNDVSYLAARGDVAQRSAALRERLFDTYALRSTLAADERKRYVEASDLADGVAGWLETHCLRNRPSGPGRTALLKTLRRFYRLPDQHKIASARACAAEHRHPLRAP